MKSATGAIFAALYALAFAVAYFQYLSRPGVFFADAPLMLVALPYTLTILKLNGSVDFSGDNLRSVLAAALFCAILAYALGALFETCVRLSVGLFRSSS
jgi:hypothetical protein